MIPAPPTRQIAMVDVVRSRMTYVAQIWKDAVPRGAYVSQIAVAKRVIYPAVLRVACPQAAHVVQMVVIAKRGEPSFLSLVINSLRAFDSSYCVKSILSSVINFNCCPSLLPCNILP
jgi:hypothetical protein